MTRGDRREPIFVDDRDRERFIETPGDACAKTGWQVHACVLMANHLHLNQRPPRLLLSFIGKPSTEHAIIKN